MKPLFGKADGLRRSLRFRFIVASVLIEIIMLGLLVGNTLRVSDSHLTALAEARLQELEESFSIALSVPLAARDHASLRSLSDRLLTLRDITYLVIVDVDRRVLVRSGEAPADLPPPDPSVSTERLVHHAVIPIEIFGQPLGRLHYGLSTAFLAHARDELLTQGLLIAVAEVLLSIVVMSIVTVLLTRRLENLTSASVRVAQGDYRALVKVHGDDEVATLSAAFNAMATAVRQHIDDLERKSEILQASNDELARLAEVTAHHLQEPLRHIGSYAQLLGQRYHGCLDEDADKYIEYMITGVRRLKRLLADLQEYVAIDMSPLPAAARVDLGQCVADARRKLKAPIEQAAAVLTVEPLPTVQGDRGQLTQVFLQLLHNALVHRRKDVAPAIRIAADASERTVTLSLADNGPGLPPQHRTAVFDLFHRIDHEAHGTGVGLPMVKKIVLHHGGRVWIETAEDTGGTRVCFTLPRLPG